MFIYVFSWVVFRDADERINLFILTPEAVGSKPNRGRIYFSVIIGFSSKKAETLSYYN